PWSAGSAGGAPRPRGSSSRHLCRWWSRPGGRDVGEVLAVLVVAHLVSGLGRVVRVDDDQGAVVPDLLDPVDVVGDHAVRTLVGRPAVDLVVRGQGDLALVGEDVPDLVGARGRVEPEESAPGALGVRVLAGDRLDPRRRGV